MSAITFSGVASGLDTDSIIKALLDARRTSLTPIEKKMEANDKESEAIDQYKTKMLKLQNLLEEFQTSSGAAIQKKATSSNSEIVGVTAGVSAQISSTTITSITSLAKAATLSFADRFTADDQPLVPGIAEEGGQISVTVGQGDSARTVNVNVTSTTNLAQIVADINEGLSGYAVASIVNTGTTSNPQYALMINGQKTGEVEGSIAINVGQEIKDQGLFVDPPNIDQATDAIFTVQGLGEIRRSTNTVSGLIPGLTFDIKKISDEDVIINTTTDRERTYQKIKGFIDAFNDLVAFSRQNSQITRAGTQPGATNQFGTLAQTRIDETALAEIREIISGTLSGVEGSWVQTAADIGISLQGKQTTSDDGATITGISGVYNFNQSDRGTDANKKWSFDEAMEKDPVAVEKLLNKIADRLTSAAANGVILNYTRLNTGLDIVKNSNTEENKTLQERIDRLNRSIEQQEATLRKVFTNLESTIGRLNQGASALSSVLSSVGSGR